MRNIFLMLMIVLATTLTMAAPATQTTTPATQTTAATTSSAPAKKDVNCSSKLVTYLGVTDTCVNDREILFVVIIIIIIIALLTIYLSKKMGIIFV